MNGEKLTGTLESADGGGIKFKSPMVGEVTITWANIKSLDSNKSFAVIPKDAKLTTRNAVAVVPQGTITTTDKAITVAAPSGPKDVSVANTNLVMPTADFLSDVNHKSGFLKGWGGAATGGVGAVQATQSSTSFNGAINLVRLVPSVTWLPASSRTAVDFNQSYGRVSQAGTTPIKTNIFHIDAERDQYFSPRLYGYGDVAFDHNFSQSLQLQEAYGGGIGMTVIKSAKQQLDVKGDIHYEKQSFFDSSQNLNLIGSTFAETYMRHLPKGIVFNEFGSVSPSWNVSRAYSSHVNANIVFPVYKGFGFNAGFVDDYLNNAAPGTNKNSSQFTTGITYTIKPRY